MARRNCSSCARQLDFVALVALALVEQRGDFQLARQRALAPDLGRVGGQHRADERMVEERAQRASVDAGVRGALEGVGQRARPRLRFHPHMGAVAADMVLVLGDVGEMREIAEGAHDAQRLVVVEAVERRLQLAPRATSLSRWKRIEAWRMRSTMA